MADEPVRGWKEIARHLDTSERTAQRWERTLGMPVRRMGSDRGWAVCAYPNELDEWRKSAAVLSDDVDTDGGDAGTTEPAIEPHPSGDTERRPRQVRRLAIALGRW